MATGELEYLDEEGLLALWAKIKATFLLKAGDTATGLITMPQLKISDTGQNKHIEFSRQGWNYITVPSTNGVLAINVAGTNASATSYAFTGTELRPGSNNAFSLGTASYQWNNIYGTTIYENGTSLAAKYAGITVESYFTNGVANNALRLSNTSKVGDTNQPVYFTASGVPSQISYTIGRNVAAGEDVTAYTAGDSINITDHVVKVSMTAQDSPTASGTAISFIDTVSQATDGTITATRKTVRSATTGQSGVVTTSAQSFAGTKTFSDSITIPNAKYINFVDYPAEGATAKTIGAIYLGSNNYFHLGWAVARAGYNTIVSGNNVALYYGTTPSLGLYLTSSGNVGVNTNNPSARLQVSGTFYATGVSTFGSTVRMLNNTSFQMRTTETNTPYRTVLTMTTGNEFQVGYSGLNMRVMAARTDFDNPIILANNKSIGWMKSDGTTTLANMISLNGSNVLAIGYAHTNTGETRLHGQSITQYVGTTKIAEVNAIGVTSYGGVAAMGIADLSIN